MKIRVLSDLHFESNGILQFDEVDCDVVVLAGDIFNRHKILNTHTIHALESFKQPIIAVAGNHEFYHGWFPNDYMSIKRVVNQAGGYFLELDSMQLGDTLFLGCTLWTDYQLYGDDVSEKICNGLMVDHKLIYCDGVGKEPIPATPTNFKSMHEYSVNWLERELIQAKNKVVIITHHAPSEHSIHRDVKGHQINPAFASNLDWLIEKYQPVLWIHGHTHYSCNYYIKKTQVVCNPYGNKSKNPFFDPNLVVDV